MNRVVDILADPLVFVVVVAVLVEDGAPDGVIMMAMSNLVEGFVVRSEEGDTEGQLFVNAAEIRSDI